MDRKIDFLLTIKLYELRRNNLEDLTLAQLKEAAFAVKWPQGLPEHLYAREAVQKRRAER